MSIKQITPQAEINAFITQQLERRTKAIINAFEYIGVSCMNEARTNGTYKDRTGNLRSSTGYVIANNGVIVKSSDQQASVGAAHASDTINKVLSYYPQGVVLIVVAGMNYASAVEARGLNVLTSSELLAQELVPKIMTELGFKK